MLLLEEGRYRAYEWQDVKTHELNLGKICTTKGKKNHYDFYQYPCSFDIETSKQEGVGCMYMWQFGINENVYIGRTWKNYIDFLDILKEKLDISTQLRLIIYVHFLSHEFQWMRKWFKWENVFATDTRKVLNCCDENGFFYKCSLMLSHKKLEEMAKDIGMEKLVGEIDYDEVYCPWTPLTVSHIRYAIYDVEIIIEKIKKEMENFVNLADIPSTMTGYVRRDFRKKCIHSEDKKHNRQYSNFMKNFTLEMEEYKMLREHVFMGGKVTSSHQLTGKTLDNVASYDITSSYPAVLFKKYPMSKGEYIGEITLEKYMELKEKCCIMARFSFKELEEISGNYGYISESKCEYLSKDHITANGIIYSADTLVTYGTDIDLDIIDMVYTYKQIAIDKCWIYKAGYLPPAIRLYTLQLFQGKTKLKGDKEKENDYMRSKNNFNSIYGMMVTSVIRDEIFYSDDWHNLFDEISIAEKEERENIQLEKYNSNFNRFLTYPWGVWVTAYARRALYSLIIQIGDDFIYCDTDSIKLLNYEKHKHKFEKYNEMIKELNKQQLKMLELKENLFEAESKEGISILGTWTFEGISEKFKTLGAKRYFGLKDGEYYSTVAGLSKKKGKEFISLHKNPFDFFSNNMVIPKEYSGRKTHWYIDEEVEATMTDINGASGRVYEKSSMIIENSEYNMTVSHEYEEFLHFIGGGYYSEET